MKKLMMLFSAGFLAAGLSACSSTPKETQTDTTAPAAQEADTQQTASAAPEAGTVETGTAGENTLTAENQTVDVQQTIAELREKRVHFDFDKSNIKPEYYDVIKAHAQFMQDNPEVKVTIAGYCDERGTIEYNLALGERRANAAYNALVAEGVSPDRIQIISYGESYPLDARHNEEAWAKNRRATFVYGVNTFVRPH